MTLSKFDSRHRWFQLITCLCSALAQKIEECLSDVGVDVSHISGTVTDMQSVLDGKGGK
jgi:hypothetical protein